MKDDTNLHIASRFTEMRLVVKQVSALFAMYRLSGNYIYLDEAGKLLGEFDESPPLPKIPYGQRDADDVRRRMRDYQREQKELKRLKITDTICEHMLTQDLCHIC